MAIIILVVPTINDSLWDNNSLANLWQRVSAEGFNNSFSFDFSSCWFLRQNAVAFLGGLCRLIESKGGSVSLLAATMRNAIMTNLQQNGFAYAMGAEVGPWRGNSVPFRQDVDVDKNEIADIYLTEQWLGRGWVSVSKGVCNLIVGQMWEIYQNAFEHGKSPVGVCSCGQYYPYLKELKLSVIDYGVGIPANAQKVNAEFTAAESMSWAFERGTTSARDDGVGRGLGLDFLKEFVRTNHGSLEIISYGGYAKIDENSERYDNSPAYFEGTLVNVGIRCDEQFYCLSNELPESADSYF